MKTIPLPRPLRGIVPPLATPLLAPDRLDLKGLERLIEHTLAGGVHALFILGSTGEATSLTYPLRHELIEQTCRQVDGRVPVLVGITDTSFGEALALAERAAGYGAAAVVHAGPFYFPIAQPELAETMANLAAASPLPLFLYNMPSHTKVNFDLDTVRRLMQVPNIAGIKDSSGQMLYFKKVLHIARERPGFAVLVGPEELLAEAIFMGAHGGVTGGANLDPKLFVDLYNAARTGHQMEAWELSARVLRHSMTIYTVGKFWSGYLQGIKGALACMGICTDVMAEPFQPLTAAEKILLERHVRELGLRRCESLV